MKIEGAIAASAAISTNVLTTEGATGLQRERTNVESARQQAHDNPSGATIATAQRAVGAKLLSTAVESVEKMLNELNENLSLKIFKDGKRMVVKVIDTATGETKREIPADHFLDMMDTFEKQISGLFVDEQQ